MRNPTRHLKCRLNALNDINVCIVFIKSVSSFFFLKWFQLNSSFSVLPNVLAYLGKLLTAGTTVALTLILRKQDDVDKIIEPCIIETRVPYNILYFFIEIANTTNSKPTYYYHNLICRTVKQGHVYSLVHAYKQNVTFFNHGHHTCDERPLLWNELVTC